MPTEPGPILVTGSSGAVGTRVAELLVADGRQVVGYDRRPLDEAIDGPGSLTTVDGDVRDGGQLVETLARHDVRAVVHAAAILPGESTPLADVAAVNVHGAAVVAESCHTAGVGRLVFTSTKGIYSDFDGEYGHPTFKPIAEDFPLIGVRNTHTMYNVTKLSAEYCLSKISDLTGLEVAMLRFATMFGPKRERHGARSIAGDIVRSMVEGEDVHVEVGGDQRFDLVHVKDVARSVVAAVDADRVDSRVYNIGSGTLITLHDVVAAARDVLADAVTSSVHIGPGLDPMRLGWANYGLFDISRAREELGYQPAYDIAAGVADYVETLRSGTPARG
jgi:UDP-glucose 4-epimerase